MQRSRTLPNWIGLYLPPLVDKCTCQACPRPPPPQSTFFGGCVPHGFPKVGSRLEKMRGLRNENLRLESWNLGQNKAENAFF